MAHHHLAIAVIFIIAGHMYRTNFGIGHSIKEMLNSKTFFGIQTEGQFNLPHQELMAITLTAQATYLSGLGCSSSDT
jgi:photosystem I P700 chlorophyll a apoprotein A2